ncbi:hypothetical protein BDZ89DRAFT_443222 [Hymenopellis radicata]|nr:hypothetical protein BDZ89DRAFT_443222 [Hymenopellis radicata]
MLMSYSMTYAQTLRKPKPLRKQNPSLIVLSCTSPPHSRLIRYTTFPLNTFHPLQIRCDWHLFISTENDTVVPGSTFRIFETKSISQDDTAPSFANIHIHPSSQVNPHTDLSRLLWRMEGCSAGAFLTFLAPIVLPNFNTHKPKIHQGMMTSRIQRFLNGKSIWHLNRNRHLRRLSLTMKWQCGASGHSSPLMMLFGWKLECFCLVHGTNIVLRMAILFH